MNLGLLSWNLFHGRDFPPALQGGPAWKLLGRPVRGERHVLVNRNLFLEFGAFLAAARWDLALLQEVPPRWAKPLAEATGAEPVRTLTSRNWMRPFTFAAARCRPHLTGSWEGGSNLLLVRRRKLGVREQRSFTLARWPERRMMTMVRLEGGLTVANLHAGTGKRAAADVLRAAELATGWAGGGTPLVLGGDFNVRPGSGDVFGKLERGFGLTGATGPDAIDHILVRNLKTAEPAAAWPPERRDVPDRSSELLVRLSDHPPTIRQIGT